MQRLLSLSLLIGFLGLTQSQSSSAADLADYAGEILSLPAVEVSGNYYWVDMLVLGDSEPVLEVVDAASRPAPLASSQLAVFDGIELVVPCLNIDENYFHLTTTLARQEPTIQFSNVVATTIETCDEDVSGHLTFMSPHSNPIVLAGNSIYVTNTPAASVDVISIESNQIIDRVPVGIDPVALAVKPDGKQVWVSNHISDSVNVIDIDPDSVTYHQVIATIQDIDPVTKGTLFDEPVGIAFASNDKAYVSLSSLDRIAVIDAQTYSVISHLSISAQDPRAIAVRNNKLYVSAFESNNQSELSGCFGTIDGDQCTFSLQEHVVTNNNVLSLGYDADIVKDPRVPDRDLFVFDTNSDSLIDTVSSVGTLLYGLTVDSSDNVYVAQTEARNEVNGRAGTLKHTLLELENRAFLNQIAIIDCGSSCSNAGAIELEPLPPLHPQAGEALATPFAIQISADDSVLVASAASSDVVFTLDAFSGEVLGRVDVDSVPRGIALRSDADGRPRDAWVLNVVANTVSVLDLSDVTAPQLVASVALEDPTDPVLKLGRAMFSSAKASTTETFSCESCHPDGHTDQLLWVLGGPQCEIAGCTQIPVRSTMPIRGLRDTAPFHWDGVPGDPYGGRNGTNPGRSFSSNCELSVPETCTLNLVDGSLSSTMCDPIDCVIGESGKAGRLSTEEREALAQFLLSIPHPPARERAFDDQLTDSAIEGFDDFFIKDAPPGSVAGQTCGSVGCHAMPFWTGTNDAGSGMDAPSFRGLQDRWLMLPQGRVNMWELINGVLGNKGFDEFTMWNQIISGSTVGEWQMFVEASMGFPGAFARQATLSSQTLTAQNSDSVLELLDAMEQSADEGTSLLQIEGLDLSHEPPVDLQLAYQDGLYRQRSTDGSYSRDQLISLAESAQLVATATSRLPLNVDYTHPQPAVWSTQNQFIVTKHAFPRLSSNEPMRLKGRYIDSGASIFVNGRKVEGEVRCESGALPDCSHEVILVELEQLPNEPGMYFLQIQTPRGLLSNEYLFHVI